MVKQSTPALGDMIDNLHNIRERIRVLNKQVDDLTAQRDVLTLKIIEMLDAMGTDQSRTDKATASITETVVANVDDWDAVNRYISRNKAFYLYERRISSAAYRELLESRKGKPIPGITPFTKRTLSLRTR